jgi:hypothetical protein
MGLGGPQNWCECCGEDKDLSLIDILEELVAAFFRD